MLDNYTKIIEDALDSHHGRYQCPELLYAPTRYIISLGGKRIRPALVLMACDSLGTDPREALNAALAIEVFHNFTLLHDDIMDDAPIRRGLATVHQKWDVNTAILSGDVMMIQAYELFEIYEGDTFKNIVQTFNRAARMVCEGQQLDMDYEKIASVSLEQYIEMIKLKTAVLLGCSLAIGAVVAHAKVADIEALYKFGQNIGLAYQLTDDYLDTFGNEQNFGKRIGGDIVEGKKTFLYIHTLKSCDDKSEFERAFSIPDPQHKIDTVRELYTKHGADIAIRSEIEHYTNKAIKCLQSLDFSDQSREKYVKFAKDLVMRKK